MKKKIQNRRCDHITRKKLAFPKERMHFSPKYSQDRSKNFFLDNEGYFNWSISKRKGK